MKAWHLKKAFTGLGLKKMRVIFLSMINLPYNSMLMQMILPCNRPALIRLLMFHLQNSSFSSIPCTLLSSTKTGALKRSSNKTTIVLRGLHKTSFNTTDTWYKNFLTQYIDTTNSPVIALFALSYSDEISQDTVKTLMSSLTKKFPKNSSVADVVKQFDAIYSCSKSTAKPSRHNLPKGKWLPILPCLIPMESHLL